MNFSLESEIISDLPASGVTQLKSEPEEESDFSIDPLQPLKMMKEQIKLEISESVHNSDVDEVSWKSEIVEIKKEDIQNSDDPVLTEKMILKKEQNSTTSVVNNDDVQSTSPDGVLEHDLNVSSSTDTIHTCDPIISSKKMNRDSTASNIRNKLSRKSKGRNSRSNPIQSTSDTSSDPNCNGKVTDAINEIIVSEIVKAVADISLESPAAVNSNDTISSNSAYNYLNSIPIKRCSVRLERLSLKKLNEIASGKKFKPSENQNDTEKLLVKDETKMSPYHLVVKHLNTHCDVSEIDKTDVLHCSMESEFRMNQVKKEMKNESSDQEFLAKEKVSLLELNGEKLSNEIVKYLHNDARSKSSVGLSKDLSRINEDLKKSINFYRVAKRKRRFNYSATESEIDLPSDEGIGMYNHRGNERVTLKRRKMFEGQKSQADDDEEYNDSRSYPHYELSDDEVNDNRTKDRDIKEMWWFRTEIIDDDKKPYVVIDTETDNFGKHPVLRNRDSIKKLRNESVRRLSKYAKVDSDDFTRMLEDLLLEFGVVKSNLRIVDGRDMYFCEFCDYSNRSELRLTNHLLMHCSKFKLYKCRYCEYSSHLRHRTHRHMNAVHGVELTYRCTFCTWITNRRDLLIEHKKQFHSGPKPYSCQDCSYATKFKHLLVSHCFHVHSIRSKDPYYCDQCRMGFGSRYLLKQHVHKKETQFVCRICNYKGRRTVNAESKKLNLGKDDLIKHMREVHFTDIYKCEHCDFTSNENYKIQEHSKASHKKTGRYRCKLCPFVAVFKGILKDHIQTLHGRAKPYDCQVCDSKFSRKDRLESHVATVHNLSSIYNCESCSFQTPVKEILRLHKEWKHSDDVNKFKCHHCSFSTWLKKDIRDHIKKVHDFKRPHHCSRRSIICSSTSKADMRRRTTSVSTVTGKPTVRIL